MTTKDYDKVFGRKIKRHLGHRQHTTDTGVDGVLIPGGPMMKLQRVLSHGVQLNTEVANQDDVDDEDQMDDKFQDVVNDPSCPGFS